ncbi:hypothetical protein ES707_10059 [subsurface metagenome]
MSTNGARMHRRAIAEQGSPGLLEGSAHLWTMRDCDAVDGCSGRAAAQSVTGWLLARLALSECFPVRPQDWRFARDGRGKPFIIAPEEYRPVGIGISHTDGLVACLISGDTTAAVDVERIRPYDDLSQLVPILLSRSEQRCLASLDGERWLRRFFEYWTLKEAFAKAVGLGLAFEFASACFEIEEGDETTVQFAAPDGDSAAWIFRRLVLGPDWAGAVAVKTGPFKTCRLIHVELEPERLGACLADVVEPRTL